MKERMFKYFTASSTRKYVDVIGEMVDNYNTTRHSSIKMTPVAASEKKMKELCGLTCMVTSLPLN